MTCEHVREEQAVQESFVGERVLDLVKPCVHFGKDDFEQAVICLALVLEESGNVVSHCDTQSLLEVQLTCLVSTLQFFYALGPGHRAQRGLHGCTPAFSVMLLYLLKSEKELFRYLATLLTNVHDEACLRAGAR